MEESQLGEDSYAEESQVVDESDEVKQPSEEELSRISAAEESQEIFVEEYKSSNKENDEESFDFDFDETE